MWDRPGVADVRGLLDDLAAEGDALEAVVGELAPDGWARLTPAEGWTVAHQVAHLAWTDEVALLAVNDEAEFTALVERALADAASVDSFVDEAAAERARLAPDDLLARWRTGRAALVEALRGVPDGRKLPWFGPPMGAASMATARLMETWAHGQDVADALGVDRAPTERLKHVAHIGVRTRDFAYAINERPAPTEPFRVELVAPGGETWVWGPDDATQRVTGPAVDFCLLVTQRRHRDDLDLRAEGADADEWLDIAQAFAGPPGTGRTPGQFGGALT